MIIKDEEVTGVGEEIWRSSATRLEPTILREFDDQPGGIAEKGIGNGGEYYK